MKGRDLAIVGVVVLLGGFALADALRSGGDDTSATTQATPDGRRGPEPQPDAPEDWPAGRLRGTVVFTDARDCRVRVIGLGGGRERPTSDFFGTCELWPAPIGQRLAYGAVPTKQERTPGFTLVDLARANRELGTFRNLSGDVLWRPDAQRVAWCDEGLNGFEFDIGDERPRRLERCPVAYAPDGQLAFAIGRRLVAGGRTIVTQDGTIAQAFWGVDGSLLVVLPNGIVRRFGPDGTIHSIRVTSVGDVLPSPDNCALLVQEPGLAVLVDVGCFLAPSRSFVAFDAAWSPDGFWVAVAGTEQIEFHRVLGGEETLVWPARARELDWRGEG
jgi:hypothetical protein